MNIQKSIPGDSPQLEKIENPCENNKEIRVGTHEIKSIYGCPLFIEFYAEGVLRKREFYKSTCD